MQVATNHCNIESSETTKSKLISFFDQQQQSTLQKNEEILNGKVHFFVQCNLFNPNLRQYPISTPPENV